MAKPEIVRNNLLLAKHHVKDAEKTKSRAVLDSSLEDIDEALTHIKDTLPNKATMDIQTKLAAVEARDAAVAFQYGFAKAAAHAGLTKDETVLVFEQAVKLAAAEAQLEVSTEASAIKPTQKVTEQKREKRESKPRVAGADATTNEDTKHTVTLPAAIKQAMAKRAMQAGDYMDNSHVGPGGKPVVYPTEKPNVAGLDAGQLAQYNSAGGTLAGIKNTGLTQPEQMQRNAAGGSLAGVQPVSARPAKPAVSKAPTKSLGFSDFITVK